MIYKRNRTILIKSIQGQQILFILMPTRHGQKHALIETSSDERKNIERGKKNVEDTSKMWIKA